MIAKKSEYCEIEEIEKLLIHQLRLYWSDIDEKIIRNAIPATMNAIENNFKGLPNSRFFCNGLIQFSPFMSVHWMIFLYRLSHEIYVQHGTVNTPKEADCIYYLNKIMHSNDWFYAVELPQHFLCEHPLGSVLGRAQYGDYFFVYQGTTVGGNRNKGQLCYPVIGNNVVLFANSTILGNSLIGDNVVVSAETYIINEVIPNNCIVFGRSPNLIIKMKSEEEIKSYTKYIWGW